jgi:hypothetical protein
MYHSFDLLPRAFQRTPALVDITLPVRGSVSADITSVEYSFLQPTMSVLTVTRTVVQPSWLFDGGGDAGVDIWLPFTFATTLSYGVRDLRLPRTNTFGSSFCSKT